MLRRVVGRGMERTIDATSETVGASRSRIVFFVFRFRFHGYACRQDTRAAVMVTDVY